MLFNNVINLIMLQINQSHKPENPTAVRICLTHEALFQVYKIKPSTAAYLVWKKKKNKR